MNEQGTNTGTTVHRITTPDVFEIPGVRDWMRTIARSMSFENVDQVIDFLKVECQQPGTQVLIGFQDDVPSALSVAMLPGSPMMVEPQVVAAYNEGDLELARAMRQAIVDFIRLNGWNHFAFVNRTGKPDEVMFRSWVDVAEGKTYGSILEFKLKE